MTVKAIKNTVTNKCRHMSKNEHCVNKFEEDVIPIVTKNKFEEDVIPIVTKNKLEEDVIPIVTKNKFKKNIVPIVNFYKPEDIVPTVTKDELEEDFFSSETLCKFKEYVPPNPNENKFEEDFFLNKNEDKPLNRTVIRPFTIRRPVYKRFGLITSILSLLMSPFLYGYLIPSSELYITNLSYIVWNYNRSLKSLNGDGWITIETVFLNGIILLFTGGFFGNCLGKIIRHNREIMMAISFILFSVSYLARPHIKLIWVYYLVRFVSGISAGIGMSIVPDYLIFLTRNSGNMMKLVVPCLFGASIALGLLFGSILSRINIQIQIKTNSPISISHDDLVLFQSYTGGYIPAIVSFFNYIIVSYLEPFRYTGNNSETLGSFKWAGSEYLENEFFRFIIIIVFPYMIVYFIGINEIILSPYKTLSLEFVENNTPFERAIIGKNHDLIINFVFVISSFFFPLFNKVSWIGMKKPLLFSALVCAICWIVLFLSRNPNVRLGAAIIYIIAYNSGISSIPYIFISELAPSGYAKYASLVATIASWLSSVISVLFVKSDDIVKNRQYIYLIYAFSGMVFFCFISFFLKEIKDDREPNHQLNETISC